ncbi:unnamed protein product [Cuscuta epithymum]|uniref:C2 domain-containing protein n=1 Tax=Cuscuta epithymum TaxID=186058 RepID=A0AAV0FKG2_9ASTE|nr:unnamed protein product [Cuscuta epithymum]
MSTQPSHTLLQIILISAHDLPPVSKPLRTYAVAWLDSGHKLTTRINRDGHNNPTWNHKFTFRLENQLLGSGDAAVNFEIYSVAWLRDTPIGTAKLALNNFFPPLLANNSSIRTAALPVRRPTGHLQGTLNVSIQFKETGGIRCHLNVPSQTNIEEVNDDETRGASKGSNMFEEYKDENKTSEVPAGEDEIMQATTNMSEDEAKNSRRSFISYISEMHPLPSKMATGLSKGYLSGKEEDYGSSIFENWSIPDRESNNNNIEDQTVRKDSMSISSLSWELMEENFMHSPTIGDNKLSGEGSSSPIRKSRSGIHHRRHHHHRRRSQSSVGLMSCFGNAYGFEYKFICGSGRHHK